MYVSPGSEKKRDNKIADKQEKLEKESIRSGESMVSKISRSTNGRIAPLAPWTEHCAWKITGEIDHSRRKYYRCACGKVERIRADNRQRHE
jgi:hypothetical protein